MRRTVSAEIACTIPSATNWRAISRQSHWESERPCWSGCSHANLTAYKATEGSNRGLRPDRGRLYNPAGPCSTKRRAQLCTCRSVNPTCLAVAIKLCPWDRLKMAWARFTKPKGVFCRCIHPCNTIRVCSLRLILMADGRPGIVPPDEIRCSFIPSHRRRSTALSSIPSFCGAVLNNWEHESLLVMRINQVFTSFSKEKRPTDSTL